jgi:energy-coupling factor transporter ATP-binding protein EcfA2
MIRLREVSFAFPGSGPRDAVAGVSLDVRDGEWVALAGGNGSGKTTLCRLMAGISRPREGSVEVDGADPAGSPDERGCAAAIAVAFQNPDSQFVTSSVEREILFGLENLGCARAEMSSTLAGAARAFGLEPLLRRNPHSLSGGEKQRALLACLWAMAPRHLVLDEPFSFLDAAGRRSFLEALGASSRGRGKTVVWSTVEEAEIALADRVVFMERGKVAFDGTPDRLAEAVPRADLARSLVRRSPHAESPGAESGAATARAAGRSDAGAIVEIASARFSPEGGGFVLDVPSLSVRGGERLGAWGPSGSGKTTLLLACAGLLAPSSGEASVFGRRIASRRDFPAGKAALLFQSPEEGFFAPTVHEEVGLGFRRLVGGVGEREAVSRALEEVGLPPGEFLDRNTFHLSQGEKRLVALASALILDAGLYLLDEPTIFLDGAARRRLLSALERLSARGAALAVASHDESFLGECTDRLVRLDHGRVAGA